MLRVVPCGLPPRMPEHRPAARLLELQRLQSRQEAALQADCLGQTGKLQASSLRKTLQIEGSTVRAGV